MCLRHNNFTARHGALQDALLLVLGSVKLSAEQEKALEMVKSSRVLRQQLRPADIHLRNWEGAVTWQCI